MRRRVELDEGFLRRLKTSPRKAIAELVWNAVDADAEVVTVAMEKQEMGGVASIQVRDDGHGMTAEDAEAGFGRLGGSWKATASGTRDKGRALHGREGRGRFFAATLAGRARWESVAETAGERRLTIVEIGGSDLHNVEIRDGGPTDRETGTTVVLDGFSEPPRGLDGADAADGVTAEFALYLTKYPVELKYDDFPIDPSILQTASATYTLSTGSPAAELDIVEWKRPMRRRLFLCNEAGTALAELQPGVQARGFEFTAYVRWEGFANDAALEIAELSAGPTSDVIDAAREKLREHFRERSLERRRETIEEWKRERVYPYPDAPTDRVEQTSRELFDVVAFTARDAVGTDQRTQRFTLRLLREALEQDPGHLRRVLEEVLDLDAARLAELNELLHRTTLSAVVSAARSITDRLDFVRGLEELVYDPETRKLTLERSQLHRILATETWIFGEEYHLLVDDESLTNVLRRHLRYLERDDLAAEPVTDEDGRTRIVDLMLAKSQEEAQNRREHLVVELKSPKVKLGHKEVDQIRDYATAVAEDPQFDKSRTHWDFWIVSSDAKEVIQRQASQRGRPLGLLDDYEGINVRIWVKTWGQLIQDARHRLKFVRSQLQYASDHDKAIRYLHERHREYVPESVLAFDEDEGAEVAS